MSNRYWSSPRLTKCGILHFFTRRSGGVSPPPYHSLNLGLSTKDNPQNVEANRKRVETQFKVFLRSFAGQVHGDKVLVLNGKNFPPPESDLPEADAMVSNQGGICLSMFFADCLPLYFWDPRTNAGGLAHAGWRSTLLDIGPKTVKVLEKEFDSRAGDLVVAMGPSIGPCCFQVGEDVALKFREKFGSEVLREEEGRIYVSLWKSNFQALLEKGVKGGNMEMAEECTSCLEDLYFSYRRDNGITGRMAGLLQIPLEHI